MIYLISNCTNSKRHIPKETLLIKNYNLKDIKESIKIWEKNLLINEEDKSNAIDLYIGHSWKETQKSIEILTKLGNVKLLISSAGYGLIDSEEKINSYQATFAKSSENSIHNFKNNSLQNPTIIWWDSINKFDLAKIKRDSYIFINVSYEYLIAMQNTIKELIETHKNKLFIIVLSKEKLPDIYNKNIITFDSRFNSFEKGTFSSIIQRFTRWLFNEIVENNIELNHKKIQTYIDSFLASQSTYKIPERTQLSDSQILEIIKDQIKTKNISSKSMGLKELRREGFACSQERYGKLFTSLKGNKNG